MTAELVEPQMFHGWHVPAAKKVLEDALDRPGNLGGPDTWEDAGS